MSISEILSLVIGFLGILVNTALWLVAYFNLKTINKQNEAMYNTRLAETVYNITQSHQNVYLTIIQNEKFTKFFNDDTDEEISNTLSTLMINHCWSVFNYANNGLISPSTFLGMENDISEIFDIPIVSRRWNKVKRYYSREFQDFIENVNSRGQRMTIA